MRSDTFLLFVIEGGGVLAACPSEGGWLVTRLRRCQEPEDMWVMFRGCSKLQRRFWENMHQRSESTTIPTANLFAGHSKQAAPVEIFGSAPLLRSHSLKFGRTDHQMKPSLHSSSAALSACGFHLHHRCGEGSLGRDNVTCEVGKGQQRCPPLSAMRTACSRTALLPASRNT